MMRGLWKGARFEAEVAETVAEKVELPEVATGADATGAMALGGVELMMPTSLVMSHNPVWCFIVAFRAAVVALDAMRLHYCTSTIPHITVVDKSKNS